MRVSKAFWALLAVRAANAQIALYNFSSSTPGLTSTCVAVINQALNCNSSILWAGQNSRFETDATLNGLCTSTCTSAFAIWLRRVNGACGTSRYQTPDRYLMLPAYLVEVYLERYNSVCLQDGSGQLCNRVIRNLAGINPLDQQSTASAVPTLGCADCLLRVMQTELQMPLSSNALLSSRYDIITKSCSKRNYTVPLTTTATTSYSIPASSAVTTTSTATATGCVGSLYTIKAGDTCQSISKSQGISTTSLLGANSIQANCYNFPTTGTLCIPTAKLCTVYTVSPNDTCATIATTNAATWTQIVSWNPDLGRACLGITAKIGYQICVSNPGGTWVNPSPGLVTTTTTSTIETVFTVPLTAWSLLPSPTYAGFGNTTKNYTIPYANATRKDCNLYISGPSNSTLATCDAVASGYAVAIADLQAWNPSLAPPAPCILSSSSQYCVQRLALVASNATQSCVKLDIATPYSNCTNMTTNYGIPLDTFLSWNPTLGPNCENWTAGYQYCTKVLHYRQPGIVSTCNQFALANVTDWVLNPCTILETQFGLSHGRFVAWNPALTVNCTGIVKDYDYCVSIPGYVPTYTSTSSWKPSSTSSSSPSTTISSSKAASTTSSKTTSSKSSTTTH